MQQHLPKHAAYTLGCTVWLLAVTASAAHATVASILCEIYDNELVGGVGPGIATMAVMAVAISAIFGKANFGMAVMAAVGIGILFSAASVVSSFGVTGCGGP